MPHTVVTPRGPYSLRQSGTLRSDATRTVRGSRLAAVVTVGGRTEPVSAVQGRDGRVRLEAPSTEALERLRFVLAVDDDHTPFLERFRDDPLLRGPIRYLGGMRPLRLATVAHALLRALCGQLIESRRARALERTIVRATTQRVGALHAPPDEAALSRLGAAELRGLGLHARRAATLLRLCAGDLERLRELPTDAAAARLERERGLGPWSVGVICLEGLGRPERGLVADLGLTKLTAALRGRRVEPWETRELLEPYGEWQGLAAFYLLRGWMAGLLPVEPLPRRRWDAA